MIRCPRRSDLFNAIAAVALVCTASLASFPARAQADSGVIEGLVVNEAGDALEGIEIRVQGANMPVPRVVRTDEWGFFRVIAVPPGDFIAELGDPSGVHRSARCRGVIHVGRLVGLGVIKMAKDVSLESGVTPTVFACGPWSYSRWRGPLAGSRIPVVPDWDLPGQFILRPSARSRR